MVDWAYVNGGYSDGGSAYSPTTQDMQAMDSGGGVAETKRKRTVCRKCGGNLFRREGKYGPFLYCENSTPKDSCPTVSLTNKPLCGEWVGWESEGPHSSFEDAYDELREY